MLVIPLCAVLGYIYNYTAIGALADKFLFRLDVGTAGRIERWFGLLDIIFENPFLLLGVSSSGFKEIVNSIGVTQIDNAYIEILLSYGIIGLLLYLFIILKNVHKTNMLINNKKLLKIIQSFTVSLLIYGLFESVILFEPGIIQWTISILLFAFPRAFYINCAQYSQVNKKMI